LWKRRGMHSTCHRPIAADAWRKRVANRMGIRKKLPACESFSDGIMPAKAGLQWEKNRGLRLRYKSKLGPGPGSRALPRQALRRGDDRCQRFARKNSRNNVAETSASNPPCTSMRWLWRSEVKVSNTLPAAPVFGSVAA